MTLLLALALFGQVVALSPQQVYTAPAWGGADLQIATPDGRYLAWYGFNCDAIGQWQNVELWLMNVPDQALLAPHDPQGRVMTHGVTPEGHVENLLCSVALLRISEEPCAVSELGVCDVAYDHVAAHEEVEP